MNDLVPAVFEVTPAFGVEYVDDVGVTRKGPLAALWSTRFEHVNQARSFPSYRGQKNFSGLYYAATMDAHVGFESWVERNVAMMLDFDPDVVAFSSQPFWLTWTQGEDKRRHPPDYFARLADGTGVVIDVRADDDIEPRDAEAFAATDRACREVGWVFQRTGGPDPTFAANVRWLAGYRHSRCYRSDIAKVLPSLRALAYAVSLRQPVLALHLSPTEDEAKRFRHYWHTWGDHLPLEVIVSPHRTIVAPLVNYIAALHYQQPELTITVILPEIVVRHWWQRTLHYQIAPRLRRALRPLPKMVITTVPFHLPH
jgi:hypothetical protein